MKAQQSSNIFCRKCDLKNEADVEALVVDRLLTTLNYPDSAVLRKRKLSDIDIGKGRAKERYRPDYVLLDGAKEPVIVMDAKSPSEDCTTYLYQVSSYALHLNQQANNSNPVRYIILTNGLEFYVYAWDSATPCFYLRFEDFHGASEKYTELRSNIAYGVFNQVRATKDVFDYQRPALDVLISTFSRCHNLIWKKEKLAPTDAFYAFAKIMFVKIREDQRIHKLIDSGKKPKREDFLFSTLWIESQGIADENPVDRILFRRLQEDLEEQIRKGTKKRIFAEGEGIGLRCSTISEVVRELEHFDLYGIDEDLNGRMFETFLNATVRGKELGQFFTPRSVVHYMTETANLPMTKDSLPCVLDACCGSGGFLIDAMARLFRDLDGMGQLTERDRAKRRANIKDRCLFGIDANDKITRIARLNMYLHGDGGSQIFKADSLDKDLSTELGMTSEEESALEELRGILTGDQRLLFDTVLTNPPFSMRYKSSDLHERRILSQYAIAQTSTGATAATAGSNVLFIERYCEVLKPGTGELFSVIDDTVLNGINSQRYRDFILEHFILLQVISLPFNTFFRAEANVKTSILHLRKKSHGEKQGDVFMAIANNVGHNDHSKDTPHRNNLNEIAQLYRDWRLNGRQIKVVEHNEDNEESLTCPMQVFTVKSAEIKPTRLDAFYYSPELGALRETAGVLSAKGKITLRFGREFDVIPELTKVEEKELLGESLKYFEIGDVTKDGIILNYRIDLKEKLPSRAGLRVRKGDIIFAKNNSSRGTTVVIPDWFDGGLVTTGFIGLRPKDDIERHLLWLSLSDEFFRKQVYYLSITASQPEIKEEIFRSEMLLVFPSPGSAQKSLLSQASNVDKARLALHNALMAARDAQTRLLES